MEQLKEYLGDALYGEVKEALKGKGKDGKDLLLAVANDGSFLPKAKFDTLYKEYRDAKEALSQGAEKAADYDRAVKENSALLQRLEAAEAKASAELLSLKREHGAENVLREAHAKNFKAVNALVDWGAVTYENGVFSGLEEQIADLRETAPYLFGGEQHYGYAPKGGSGTPDFSAMSDAEYYQLMKQKG